jgi:hypothetical protein
MCVQTQIVERYPPTARTQQCAFPQISDAHHLPQRGGRHRGCIDGGAVTLVTVGSEQGP